MKTTVFLDLDGTLWKKQPWGGIISANNSGMLRSMSNDVHLVINTGRPQSHVKSSLLRAGNDVNSTASWQDLYLDELALPLSTFAAGIFEDGLIVKVNENKDDNFNTIFNSLDIATPKYLNLCNSLFDNNAQDFHRSQGIELIVDGVITQEPNGQYVIRDDVFGTYLRKLKTDRLSLYRQSNETTKLTYKPPLGPSMDQMKIDYNHPAWLAVEAHLNFINRDWKNEAGVDLPPDAIDLYPLKLQGHESGEIYRKAEANAILLKRWPQTQNVVYVGDGVNDARAMKKLEENFEGRCLFISPYKSNDSVIEFIKGKHNPNTYAHHLERYVSIDDIMLEVTSLMSQYKML